ncbi:hypothetical protein GUJ93_ZPchr0010g8472 [Zizania palustris]|uniref:Uncharacterized protein n=1 Tax=Zizania palustris TaxID=103762 RepID=A0A8J5W971_ZIZPA|nr:hypothetical protein GUJ93_ZPchr0010g8472 [Zizania palustris]
MQKPAPSTRSASDDAHNACTCAHRPDPFYVVLFNNDEPDLILNRRQSGMTKKDYHGRMQKRHIYSEIIVLHAQVRLVL